MAPEDNSTTPKRSRRGSEKRQKQRRITFRVTPDERAKLEEAAGGAGLTLASYVRDSVLAAPQTQRRRRPPVEREALAQLLGQTSKAGSNVHQLLKRVNFGETPLADDFRETLTDYRQAVGAILAVMGRSK